MFSLIILPAVSFTRRMQMLMNAFYGLLFKIYRPCVLYSMKRWLYNSWYYFHTNKQKKPLASLVQPDEKEEEKIISNLRPR